MTASENMRRSIEAVTIARCADAIEMMNKAASGHEWVKDSLWAKVLARAASAVRGLMPEGLTVLGGPADTLAVELVARALAADDGYPPDQMTLGTSGKEPIWTLYVPNARAVLRLGTIVVRRTTR